MTTLIIGTWLLFAAAIWFLEKRSDKVKTDPMISNQRFRRRQRQRKKKTYRQRYTYEPNLIGPAVMSARKTTKLK